MKPRPGKQDHATAIKRMFVALKSLRRIRSARKVNVARKANSAKSLGMTMTEWRIGMPALFSDSYVPRGSR